MGTDIPVDAIENSEALTQFHKGVFPTYYFRDNFIPSENKLLASRFDDSTFSDDFVNQFFQKICNDTGFRYKLIQPRVEIRNSQQLFEMIDSSSMDGQIIHSLVFKNNLFTLILPPNWNRLKKSTLIVNGFYGPNKNLFRLEGPSLLPLLGKYKNTIALLWNSGGTVAGHYGERNAPYVELNDFLQVIGPLLNINMDQVITFGGSRGGYTAFQIASHPALTAIKVKYIISANTPNDQNFTFQLNGSTVPSLMQVEDSVRGYYGTWCKNLYPTHISKPEDFLTDSQKLNKLKMNNVQIFMEIGSHDNIVPTISKLKLYNVLKQKKLKVELRLNYLRGHSPDRIFRDQLISKILRNPSGNHIKKGRITGTSLNDESHEFRLRKISQKRRPLTVEIPRYMNPEIPSPWIATGTPGESYRITLKQSETSSEYNINIVLDNEGFWIQELNSNFLPFGQFHLVRLEKFNKTTKTYIKMDSRNIKNTVLPAVGPLELIHKQEACRTLTHRPEILIYNLIYGPNGENRRILEHTPLAVNYGFALIEEN